MSLITTFEILDEAIKKAGGKPTVLEALWDGDTQGWYLLLSLYTVSGIFPFKRTKYHFLGTVGVPEGMPVSTKGRWTEAELADQFGNKAAQKYNLTFYFPSKKDADDDCPRWTERHLAIECADCGKLIIPTDSPHLPKDICYNCHLTRESNEELINATPCDEGVNMYLSKENEYMKIGYCTHFDSFTIAPFISKKVEARINENAISIVKLGRQDIIELKNKLENVLNQKLDKYELPVIEEEKKRFFAIQTLEYKGKEYKLFQNFNSEHIKISELIHSVNTAEEALAGNYTYKFFFKNGFTHRDDSVLRFVNYVSTGTANTKDINARYANILTENDVTETLKKLERIGCVTIENNQVSITQLGKCIV